AWYPSLYAPRTGGAYDSHHRTAGIAGRTRRREKVIRNGINTDQIGQTMNSLSSWPNGKSPRAVGTNFIGLLADRADKIDLGGAAVDQQSKSSNRGARGGRPEDLLPDLVEGEEVVEVGEEHLRLHHPIERTAGGLKGALQVIQNVAGLLLYRRAV